MIKKKSGVSYVVVIISIMIFLILLSIITISSNRIINNTKKKQFAKEIYEIQNLVDKYKYENEELPYTVLDDNTKESILLEITDNIKNQFKNEDITEDNKIVLYLVDLNKIGAENITKGTRKDKNSNDVYVFSNKTGIVYYAKGYRVGNNIYYTLTEELKSQIGYGNETSNESNSKVIYETANMDYIQDGLVLLLDGIKNSRGGHSTNTNIWEDLSGNNYDVTMENITINDNSMYFSETDSIMYSSNSIDAVSVEMVLELEESSKDSQYIASFGSPYKILAWTPNDTGFSLGHQKKRYLVENLYTKNYIMAKYNPDAMYLNGKKLENNVAYTSWSVSAKYPFMVSGYANGFRLKGKIYSIRVYNRALTEDEINHNYQMDKKRFGI